METIQIEADIVEITGWVFAGFLRQCPATDILKAGRGVDYGEDENAQRAEHKKGTFR